MTQTSLFNHLCNLLNKPSLIIFLEPDLELGVKQFNSLLSPNSSSVSCISILTKKSKHKRMYWGVCVVHSMAGKKVSVYLTLCRPL